MQYEEEEGEIIDDDDDAGLEVYNPLRRPESSFFGQRVEDRTVSIADDPLSSDDDHLVIPPLARPSNPLNKYNVWQIDVSEDLCSSLNFSLNDNHYPLNDRHVESYQYLPPKYVQEHKKESKADLKNFRGTQVRRLAPLGVTENNSVDEIAKDICKKLHEKNQALIYNAVSVIGRKKSILLYRKTRKIEKNGGLLIKNRSRQRTSGGVFLYLLHVDKDLTPSQLKEIFQEEDQPRRPKKKKKIKMKSLSLDLSDLKTRGELELERVVRTPPPSPVAPSSPPSPRLCTDTLLDQTSALLARTNDMQAVRKNVLYARVDMSIVLDNEVQVACHQADRVRRVIRLGGFL